MMNERITLFVDVLLPLPVPGAYTYRVPYEMNEIVQKGARVVVQFGQKKIYTALVVNIHEKVPAAHTPKYILSVLDEWPVVNNIQLDFWEWIASYYMCRPGEVMNAALPSALKLASESALLLHPEYQHDTTILNEKEFLIAEALEIRQRLTLSEVSGITEQKTIIPLVRNLIEKKVAIVEEELKEKYKPRKESCIRLHDNYINNETLLHELLDKLSKKAPGQLNLMMAYLHLKHPGMGKTGHLTRRELIDKSEATHALLLALIKKEVFTPYEISISRLEEYDVCLSPESIILSTLQQEALSTINKHFTEKDVVLLHGITASGKTEIYIKLIDETIKAGKQVLFLLPEIALTSQIINRLRKYFGNTVGVYHSRYNTGEKVEIWNRVLANGIKEGKDPTYKIILGARSALFLPFSCLGLVIVDEEHDTSYKQYDPAPRYQARDAAIYLAMLHKAKVLLGSATPSVESSFNCISGKYGLAELNKRYSKIVLPEIVIANLREENRKKTMKSHFSSILFSLIGQALNDKEQIILFQNRRGFSTRIECKQCCWIPQCKYCDVTLIYHKKDNLLKCHYCGYSTNIPKQCPACGGTHLHTLGFGTERIEEETGLLFPAAKTERMDLDTTRSKNAYLNIINDFEDRLTDILIGTQMVTKGLDFDNVSVVGIMNADNMLNFPDFRAHERAFQMIEQVSGRAGRKNKRGIVVIQTSNPSHPVINHVIQHDYKAMLNQQLAQRKKFNYPPYYRIILITLKHKEPARLNEAAELLARDLRPVFGKFVFGPEYPMISRIKNFYLKNIMIKIERNAKLNLLKSSIEKITSIYQKKYSSLRIVIDVDPL